MPSLHWTGKDAAVVAVRDVPYRPLVAVPSLSYGDLATENLLIQGDNLDALKSLLPVYAGRVKCVFIDPPYNTRSAFEHYDDNREHSIWLSMMYPRLELLRELLSEDGSIWVTIDDNEGHYLKVMMDEVFGRGNFVTGLCWEKVYTLKNTARLFSEQHDHILIYSKQFDKIAINHLPRSEKQNLAFKNPDNDPRGPWLDSAVHARNFYSKGSYSVTGPTGREFSPPQGRYWTVSRENFEQMDRDGTIWWGRDGNNVPRKKAFLSEVKQSVVPGTIWGYQDSGENAQAKSEIKTLVDGITEVFITVKPERLLRRILLIATNPGDLILDSFLGSGTTAAVAHKMGRRWIGVEMGDHAETHCAARLRKVLDGEQGGISKDVNWQGGGGFRFCRLGEAVFDGHGSIRQGVGFADLARWVWYRETRRPLADVPVTPLLGIHQGAAYYLLYNGILGDRRPEGGNVLTAPLLDVLAPHDGPRVVFGEACRLHESKLAALNLRFRQLPYQANA
jgi:adenine-specific DNA-methyltransferase